MFMLCGRTLMRFLLVELVPLVKYIGLPLYRFVSR